VIRPSGLDDLHRYGQGLVLLPRRGEAERLTGSTQPRRTGKQKLGELAAAHALTPMPEQHVRSLVRGEPHPLPPRRVLPADNPVRILPGDPGPRPYRPGPQRTHPDAPSAAALAREPCQASQAERRGDRWVRPRVAARIQPLRGFHDNHPSSARQPTQVRAASSE
jgi:hypothetical protein